MSRGGRLNAVSDELDKVKTDIISFPSIGKNIFRASEEKNKAKETKKIQGINPPMMIKAGDKHWRQKPKLNEIYLRLQQENKPKARKAS